MGFRRLATSGLFNLGCVEQKKARGIELLLLACGKSREVEERDSD